MTLFDSYLCSNSAVKLEPSTTNMHQAVIALLQLVIQFL